MQNLLQRYYQIAAIRICIALYCTFFLIGMQNFAGTAVNTLQLFGLRAKRESQQELLGKYFANLQNLQWGFGLKAE